MWDFRNHNKVAYEFYPLITYFYRESVFSGTSWWSFKGKERVLSTQEIMTLGLLYLYFVLFSFFFKELVCFGCGLFLKSLLNLLQYCFHFMFCFFFWPWGVWGFSFLIRDWTHTPCIGRWSLNHWEIREVPGRCFLLSTYLYKQMVLLSHTLGKNSSRKITFPKLNSEYIVWQFTYG